MQERAVYIGSFPGFAQQKRCENSETMRVAARSINMWAVRFPAVIAFTQNACAAVGWSIWLAAIRSCLHVI